MFSVTCKLLEDLEQLIIIDIREHKVELYLFIYLK